MAELRREGVRYARDHAGRLPTVLAVRLARVWNVYDPLQVPEGRSARAEKLGVAMYFLLVALALAGALTLRRRRRELWILLAPVVLVCVTALLTYGNQRFRAPAEITLVVLAAVALRRGLALAARAPRAPHELRRVACAAIVALGVAVRVAHTLLVAPWPPEVFNDEAYYATLGAADRARRGLHPAGRVLRRGPARSRPRSARRCSRWRWPAWPSSASAGGDARLLGVLTGGGVRSSCSACWAAGWPATGPA